MTNYKKYLYPFTSVMIILFFLLACVHFWCYNEAFYRHEHESLTLYGKSIAEHIGISDEELADLTHFTLIYLNDPQASLDRQMVIKGEMREVFTDDEKLHMEDVRRLNLAANYICIVSGIFSLIVLIMVIRNRDLDTFYFYFKKVLLYLGVVFGILGAWVFIDFDSFWTFFHHIFFAGNELWLLDLRTDILIMIVPPEFFDHLVITIFFSFIILTGIFYLGLRYFVLKGQR